MKLRTLLFLAFTHISVGIVGFAAGVYFLPILIAPPAPTDAEVSAISSSAIFSGEFRKDLAGSDSLHWGEGKVSISSDSISLMGEIAPGPDYKLYLSPQFVETEADFERIKPSMQLVGDVKTFENFLIKVSPDIDPSAYTTVIVWCETFGEFITAAKYQ